MFIQKIKNSGFALFIVLLSLSVITGLSYRLIEQISTAKIWQINLAKTTEIKHRNKLYQLQCSHLDITMAIWKKNTPLPAATPKIVGILEYNLSATPFWFHLTSTNSNCLLFLRDQITEIETTKSIIVIYSWHSNEEYIIQGTYLVEQTTYQTLDNKIPSLLKYQKLTEMLYRK